MKYYYIATMAGSVLVKNPFKTMRQAQNKLRDLTERGIIAGIPVKIIESSVRLG